MSGYQKPSVLVWQEIVRESPGAGSVPLLTTIVAPFRAVRQHVDYGRNLMVGKFSNATITFEEVFKFNFPGMEVIPEEVKVLASGEFSLFETDETFTITTGGYVLTDNINHTNPDLLKAEVGDTLILKDGTSDVVTRIINVTVEETSIAFTLSNIIQNTAAYSYEVVKSLELVNITASPLVDTNLEQAKLTITAGATASTPFGNLELRYCDIFVEYMAIRKDKTAEVMFVNSNTLQSVVDISDERNPLGYAASMALMANGGMEIALISAEDTEEGHMRAISTMKSFAVARTDVYLYYLSVITDYPAFFDLYIAMIDEGTDPSKARYACLHRYTTV
ncbi:MAG: hypothetical protein WCY49_07410, partial [Anaerovoracaceae bacterium]